MQPGYGLPRIPLSPTLSEEEAEPGWEVGPLYKSGPALFRVLLLVWPAVPRSARGYWTVAMPDLRHGFPRTPLLGHT
jgi:hypothetical protein